MPSMPNITWNCKTLDNLRLEILDCSSAKGRMKTLLEEKGFTIRKTSKRKNHLSVFWEDWGDRLGGFGPNKLNEKAFRVSVAEQLVENITNKLKKLSQQA